MEKKFSKLLFLFFIICVNCFSQKEHKLDTITIKIDYDKYKETAYYHYNKCYDISKEIENLTIRNDLLPNFYAKDSLKLSVIPMFSINSSYIHNEKATDLNLIDFKQNFFYQTVYVENNKNTVVSNFTLFGDSFSDNDYTVDDPFFYLYLNKNFNEFLKGGGGYDYKVVTRNDKNFINFTVKGFKGEFVIEKGILYYIVAFKKEYVTMDEFSIPLDGTSIPNFLDFKKVEFSNYIKKCFCETELTDFVKKSSFNEDEDKMKCLKKISNKNSKVAYFLKVNN